MKRLLTGPLLDAGETGPWVTASEWAAAAAFGSARRRAEYLTWRTMVRRELGRCVEITYDAAGAPCLADGSAFLSVSHCPQRVAVCISDAPCAVDVESEERDFGRVADRYMTSSERALSAEPWWPAAVWCAKETLYKYARRRELDLLRDLHVLSLDAEAGRIVGSIAGGAPLSLSMRREEGCMLVCIL